MPKRWPTRPTRAVALALAGALVVVLGACDGGASADPQADTPASTSTERPAPAPAPPAPVLVAAGDIACAPGVATTPSQCQQVATAAVVESLDPDAVATLGDLQYERGERAGFDASYDPAWGRFRDRTRPAPGNHEYAGGKANGYFGYWGGAAHPPGGWYSYDLGAWHVVVLNSVCAVVGCGEGSEQLAWLRQDLADHPVRCTLAYWHHPRWSSGLHGPDTSVAPLWDALAAAGADVVLSGHDHHYERFAPVDGVRQFVVGTGGRSLYPVLGADRGSERVETSTFGVLALTLRPDGYDWRFVPIPGSTFTDAGSAGCG